MHRHFRLDAATDRLVRRVSLLVLLFAVVSSIASPHVLIAASDPPTNARTHAPSELTGTFVALSVPDLEASARWYERTFGMSRIMTVPRTGAIAGVVALEGPGLIVELIQHDSARVATERPELTHGIAKAGFIVDDFQATVAALEARGVKFFSGPYPARTGVRANAMFRDNAGNVWQVFGKKG